MFTRYERTPGLASPWAGASTATAAASPAGTTISSGDPVLNAKFAAARQRSLSASSKRRASLLGAFNAAMAASGSHGNPGASPATAANPPPRFASAATQLSASAGAAGAAARQVSAPFLSASASTSALPANPTSLTASGGGAGASAAATATRQAPYYPPPYGAVDNLAASHLAPPNPLISVHHADVAGSAVSAALRSPRSAVSAVSAASAATAGELLRSRSRPRSRNASPDNFRGATTGSSSFLDSLRASSRPGSASSSGPADGAERKPGDNYHFGEQKSENCGEQKSGGTHGTSSSSSSSSSSSQGNRGCGSPAGNMDLLPPSFQKMRRDLDYGSTSYLRIPSVIQMRDELGALKDQVKSVLVVAPSLSLSLERERERTSSLWFSLQKVLRWRPEMIFA